MKRFFLLLVGGSGILLFPLLAVRQRRTTPTPQQHKAKRRQQKLNTIIENKNSVPMVSAQDPKAELPTLAPQKKESKAFGRKALCALNSLTGKRVAFDPPCSKTEIYQGKKQLLIGTGVAALLSAGPALALGIGYKKKTQREQIIEQRKQIIKKMDEFDNEFKYIAQEFAVSVNDDQPVEAEQENRYQEAMKKHIAPIQSLIDESMLDSNDKIKLQKRLTEMKVALSALNEGSTSERLKKFNKLED